MDTQFVGKIIALVVLVFFWGGRFAYSALMGKRVKTNVISEIVSGRFWISATIYFIFPILALVNVYPLLLIMIVSTISVTQLVVGSLVSLFGLALMILARLHRESDWGFMGDSAGNKLFTKGIYSITRHPYYVGAICVAIGIYIVLNTWLVLSVILVIIFVRKVIQQEDVFLEKQFGNQWIVYSQKVGVLPWF